MVKRHELFYTHQRCELECVAIGAVPPSDAVLVLLVGVLGVMDQQISAGRKFVAGGPLRLEPSAIAEAEGGLVVGQIDGGTALRLDAISYSRVRMTDERRLNVERTDFKGGTWDVVTGYAREGAKVHGKKRWGEVTTQAGAERKCAARRPPNVDVNARMIERTEEAQPLNMIHVEVCEENVDASDI
jgi:hypothetical protein